MNNSPSFFELPDVSDLNEVSIYSKSIFKKIFNKFLHPAHPNSNKAPAMTVFLSQSIDHAGALLLSLFFLTAGLSLFSFESLSLAVLKSGPSFWIGFWGLNFVCAFSFRFAASIFRGRSLGALAMGIEYDENKSPLNYHFAQAFEALCFAVPALWLLEILARASGTGFIGSSYKFRYNLKT